MSGRVQINSSTAKSKKARKERNPRHRDHSTESSRSVRSEFNDQSTSYNKLKDDDRRRDSGVPKKGTRSPRRGKEYGKEVNDKGLPTSKTRSRRDEIKPNIGKLESLNFKGKDAIKIQSTNERHPLFQDNSRLAQLIGQLTNSHDEYSRRLSAGRQFQDYLFDAAHLEPIKRHSNNIFSALGEILCERGHNELKDIVITSLGTVGHLLGIDCDRLFKWVFSKFPAATNDPVGVLYLKIIVEALQLDVGKQVFYESMPMLMRNLLEVLENADIPDLLLVIMQIISVVATDYPHIFAEYFRDTVDILVGWHIDTTQGERLMRETSECLVGFHAYWVSDMGFSLMLLSQFLEDMEAYAEELNGISAGEFDIEDTPSPFVSLPKLNALVQVYTTVVKGIGEYFVPGRGGQVSPSFVDKTIARIIDCVDICGYKFRFEKLLVSANSCLSVLVHYLGNHFANSSHRVVVFLQAQLKSDVNVTYIHVKSVLTLLEQVIIHVGSALTQTSIEILVGTESAFLELRLIRNDEIFLMLLSAMQSLIGIKNVAFVQAAYKYLVKDLTDAYSKLKQFCVDEVNDFDEQGLADVDHCSVASSQQEESVSTQIKKGQENTFHVLAGNLQKIIIFDLSVLAEIATVKSPVVGAWQVDPPTFTVLTKELDPVHMSIGRRFPMVQYAILCTLFVHCQRSNHYIPVSMAKTFFNTQEFIQITKILCSVLRHSFFSLDCRSLCLLWLTDMVPVIQSLPKDQIRKHVPMKDLVEVAIVAAYGSEQSLRKEAYACIQALLNTGCIPSQTFHRALVESIVHLDDMDSGIRELFSQLLLTFPVDVIAGLSSGISRGSKFREIGNGESTEMTSKRDLWLAKKMHMARLPSVALHSHQFKTIMSYLLLGVDIESETGHHWVEELCYGCQRLGKVPNLFCNDFGLLEKFGHNMDSTLPFNCGCSESLIWFWVLWETAQFCILSRLKTPLGKATDTFHSIEGVIKDLERELTGTKRNGDEFHFTAEEKKDKEIGSEQSEKSLNKLEQAVLVLQFLINLEKLMYNAYEGSAVSLPPPSKAVRTFFRINRVTCQEWLARIRESTTHLSVVCGYSASAAHHGMLWLQSLQAAGNFQGTEFERAITLVVIALSQLHAWESVTGVLEWCKRVAGRNFFWLSGMVPLASGNLERASEQLKTGFEQYLSPDRQRNENAVENKKSIVTVLTKEPVIHANPLVTHALLTEVLDCYVKLGDWNEVQGWAKNVQEWHKKLPCIDGLDSSFDINLVRALSKFEDNDFSGVREMLDLVPGATMGEIIQEQFPVLGAVKDEKEVRGVVTEEIVKGVYKDEKRWQTASSLLYQSQTNLLQAVTLYWTSGLNTLKGSRIGSLHSSTWETVEDLLNKGRELMFTCLRVCQLTDSVESAAPFIMQLQCINAIGDALLAGEDDQEIKPTPLNVSEQKVPLNPAKTDVSVLSDAIRTASYIQFHRSRHKKGWVEPTIMATEKVPDVGSFRVLTAKVARKQGNIRLAEALLAKQLAFAESKGASEGKSSVANSAQLKLKQLSSSVHSGRIAYPLAAVEILVESAKLKRLLGNQGDGVDSLCSAVLLAEKQFLISQKTIDVHKLSSITAKSVLTLSKWLQYDPKLVTPAGSEVDDHLNVGLKVREVVKAIQKSCGFSTKLLQNASSSNLALSETDKICGQLLNYGTHRSPQFGKSWFGFADWCYKWGRRAVEHASMIGRIELTDDERDQICKLLPESIGKDRIDVILGILSKAHCTKGFSGEEDISATELLESMTEDDEEGIKKQLVTSFPDLFQDRKDLLDVLLHVSDGIVDRLFSHYKHAVLSYFTFLKLVGGETTTDESNKNEYGNITATLRLLRLLVKYSGELKLELEQQLKETPTRPWQGIIPQLFARLNHPEPYVQNSVAALLCRIARDSPHLIVYQTVVGCSELVPAQLSKSSAAGVLKGYKLLNTPNLDQPQNDVVDSTLEQEQEESAVDSQEDGSVVTPADQIMQSSLHTILDVLSEDNNLLVSEVQRIVQELRRITVLWDELWIGSLLQLHHEAQRRIPQLEDEIKRVQSNETLTEDQKGSLIKEKHSALMRPIIYSLERLEKITSQAPETPHEENFQKTFGDVIRSAIDKLKNPEDPSKPVRNWEPMKQLHAALQSRSQRRSSNNLSMEDISPTLAKTKFSLVPMPGVGISEDQIVTLDTFSPDVIILPTKTKPKKLVMIGSDGQRYTYLFKGLEDLHLDERIMQFLQICNHMFAKEDKSSEKRYVARRYSVTPLGPRSGLIQWVDGATPIFALYKRWQQREAAAQASAKAKDEKGGQHQHITPTRPSELFYSRISPLLKEKGIHDGSLSRKEWPLSILKKVFLDLSGETPCDLLSRELWCSSTGASDWWEIFQTYSRSVAVMSVIGYIIGLGDRHLDNILVDLSTGEVVHIDYNVCFEKGKALRVPEKVPFRMTRNLEAALGITGVDGLFRMSCEKVMHILRHGKETLLTLLEAFVYDPLVDWTTANDAAFAGAFYGGGAGGDEGNKFSKKEMERSITRTLLSTRIAEMKVAWAGNRDELLTALSSLSTVLESFLGTLESHQNVKGDLANFEYQLDLLQAALQKPDHPLHTLQARYDKQAKLLGDLKSVRQKLLDKLNECEQYHKQHLTVFERVRGKDIAAIYSELCERQEQGNPFYAPASSFLLSAGQSNLVSQCDQMEKEMMSVNNQRKVALKACMDAIINYSSVIRQFPDNYPNQTWCRVWAPWLQELREELTVEKCKTIYGKHSEVVKLFNSHTQELEPIVLTMEDRLRNYHAEQNTRVLKLCERRSQEAVETSSLSGPVTETWNALRRFVGDTGASGATSLACVTITALSTLNRRYLVMENAATVASERLMYLTSRDGDWFLDELCTICGNIAQLLSVLKNNPMRSTSKNSALQDRLNGISNCMQVIFSSVKVYASLQELFSNFRSIIVPETVKGIQTEDPSVLQMIETVRLLVNSSPIPLSTIAENLLALLKDEESDLPPNIGDIILEFRRRLEKISDPEENEENGDTESSSTCMTPGQMLLAGFSGLFTKVENELSTLYDLFRKLSPVDGAEHIDLYAEQKNLKMSKKLSVLPSYSWANFLFIKRLQVIQGFFTSSLQQAGATKDIESLVNSLNNGINGFSENCNKTPYVPALKVFNEDLLVLPVKQFIADAIQLCVVGVPSQALTFLIAQYIHLLSSPLANQLAEGEKGTMFIDEICKKMVEFNLRNSTFAHQHLSQASTLINAHDVAWRKHDLARRLDAAIVSQKDIADRSQLQVARFQWLYEDALTHGTKKQPFKWVQPSRKTAMNDIKKRLQSISQVEGNLANLMEKFSQLQSSIEQRLKWAAGANPKLNSVLKNFEDSATERKRLLSAEAYSAPEIKGIANSLIRLESFRHKGAESTQFDASAVNVLNKCIECCDALDSCTGELGDVEQLMNNLQISIPPKEPITAEWMKSRIDTIEKKIKSLHAKDGALCTLIATDRENLRAHVGSVKGCLNGHHALVSEVKSMLKALAKDEEAPECFSVRNFISLHNRFSEDAASLLKRIINLCTIAKGASDDQEQIRWSVEDDREMLSVFKELTRSVNNLHDHLLSFGSSFVEKEEDQPAEPRTFASALRKNSLVNNGSSSELTALQSEPTVLAEEFQSRDGGNVAASISPTAIAKQSLVAPSPKKNQAGPARDPKTGKAMQERNTYAVSVWRRVKAKLEGRDVDANRRLTIAEQVDYIISDATNIDYLCQLYEGWTPWV